MIGANTSAMTLADGARYGVHWRYRQKDSTGAWVDFRTLGGIDWCESVEWGKTVDDPTVNATISLRREVGTDSLAPLVEDSPLNQVLSSYVPLVHMARRFTLDVAIKAVGASPSGGDWFTIVEGATDGVSWGGKPGTVQINARDDMQLLDYLVIESESFGAPGGTPLETVMQDVLDHYLGGSAPTLEFADDLDFSVTEFTTSEGQTLREVMDQLAGHVGGYVEHRWWSAASALRLVVMMPDRASDTAPALHTFGPEQYLDVKRMDWDRLDVRNIVKLRYMSAATDQVETATYTNSTSITEMGGSPFGERPIVFTEPTGSALDTAAEAQDFVDLVGADLSLPLVEQEVENLFWPWVELGDYYQWEPNFRVTDQAFIWAVVGFRHRLSATERRTTIQTSGQAKGGVKRWQRRSAVVGPQGEIAEVLAELADLESYINGAFEDDVISAAEAIAIEEHVRQLNNEKADVDQEYTTYYNHPLIQDPAKSQLNSAKADYDTRHAALLTAISTAIADGAITPTERTAVDTAFANYRSYLASYRLRQVEAVNNISYHYADAAADAALTAANAYTNSQITTSSGSVIIVATSAPSTRAGGAALQTGDQWVDSDAGNKVYFWNGSWGPGETQIEGDRIKTGTTISGVTYTGVLVGVTGEFAGTVSASAVVATESFSGPNPVFTGTLHVGSTGAAGGHLSFDALSFTNSGGSHRAYFGITGGANALISAPAGIVEIVIAGSTRATFGGSLSTDQTALWLDVFGLGMRQVKVNPFADSFGNNNLYITP